MRLLKLRKNTGCVLEAVVFDNGLTVACWQTSVPEVGVYQNLGQFLSVRTRERGYEIISDRGKTEGQTKTTVWLPNRDVKGKVKKNFV